MGSPISAVIAKMVMEDVEQRARILNSYNVKVAKKPLQTLGHIFAKPKGPVTKEQRTDASYSIPCNDCEYIGQTKR